MQRRRVLIAAIVNFSLCLAVSGQVDRQGGRVRTTTPQIVAQPANGNVVIYARKNFAGQSMVLAVGDQRLTDLKPASIRVPQGTDPDKIDQRIEQQIFKKEPGHYAFTVTRRDVVGQGVLRDR